MAFEKVLSCSLQLFTGILRTVSFLQYLEKRAVIISGKTPFKEKNSYYNYMISLQSVIIPVFFYNLYNLSVLFCDSHSFFSVDIAEKICNPLKFIYSEKGKEFCKISTVDLSYVVPVKFCGFLRKNEL